MKSKKYRGIKYSRPAPDKNKHVHDANYKTEDNSENVLLAIEQNLKVRDIIHAIPKFLVGLCTSPSTYETLEITNKILSKVAKIPLTPENAEESLKARIEALK